MRPPAAQDPPGPAAPAPRAAGSAAGLGEDERRETSSKTIPELRNETVRLLSEVAAVAVRPRSRLRGFLETGSAWGSPGLGAFSERCPGGDASRCGAR